MKAKYKRILIKLSGEALAGEQGHGLDESVISRVVSEIEQIHNMGVEIALVSAEFLPVFRPRLL